MRRDLAVALGALRRAPAFAIACVLSLAVGVGLNGTVFALLDASLFRPAPYREPERLLTIQDSRRVPDNYLLSYDEVEVLRDQSGVFEQTAAYRAGMAYRYELHLSRGATNAAGMAVTASMFQLVDVRPMLGRVLVADDERGDAAPVVVLGANLWRRAFDANTAIVGTSVRIDRRTYTVVGVMPDGFWFPSWNTEFWTPLSPAAAGFSRAERSLSFVGRVATGVSADAAATEVARRTSRLDPPNDRRARRWWRIDRFAEVTRPGDIGLLAILQAVVLAVLLLACINVSNLMLVRTSVRRRDWAIRASLGASRWERVRPLVAEAALLAVATAVVGAALALVSMRVIAATFDRAVLGQVITGGTMHVAGVAIIAAALALVLGAAAPVVQVFKSDARLAFADGSIASGFGRGTRRLRHLAVATQVACSVALCATTALLVRGLQHANAWKPGFSIDGLLLARPDAAADGRVVVPRIVLASAMSATGVSGAALSQSVFPDEGRIIADAGLEANDCTCQRVSYDFLRTIGIPVRHGRGLTPVSAPDDGLVVVDERLARMLWSDPAAAVGRRMKLGVHARWLTVVGVVEPTEFTRPTRGDGLVVQPAVYVLTAPDSLSRATLFVRVAPGVPIELTRARVARELRGSGADELAAQLTTIAQTLDASLRPMYAYARLFGMLATLALMLAVIGLNGVLGYHVVTTYRERGIRAALGASPRALFGDVMRDAARLTSVGALTGTLVAGAAGQIVTSLLLERSESVGAPLAAAAAVAVFACFAASLPAALRAASVSPARALRD